MVSTVSLYTGILEYPERRNTSFSSSMVAVLSTATMSTRGVRISLTVLSSNSMADLIRSLSAVSISPSSSISSTMMRSSSSVRVGTSSVSVLVPLATTAENFSNIQVNGVKTLMRIFMIGAMNVAIFSAWAFARLLGVISPTARMTTSMNAVAYTTPMEPNLDVKM